MYEATANVAAGIDGEGRPPKSVTTTLFRLERRLIDGAALSAYDGSLRSVLPRLLESRHRGETMISFKRQAGLCAALALTAGTWLASSKADDAMPPAGMMPVADFPRAAICSRCTS